MESAFPYIFIVFIALFFVGSLWYLDGPKLCMYHKPKKMELKEPITGKVNRVQYCPYCRKMEYIEE